MARLRHPRAMADFDPSKAALLHESLNDHFVLWDPRRADDWRRSAKPHSDGLVHWDGYVFDAWSPEMALAPDAVKPS